MIIHEGREVFMARGSRALFRTLRAVDLRDVKKMLGEFKVHMYGICFLGAYARKARRNAELSRAPLFTPPSE
jgi:hypothetical protein